MISDSSEKILQRGRGKVRIYVILVKVEYMHQHRFFGRSFLLVTRSSHQYEGF